MWGLAAKSNTHLKVLTGKLVQLSKFIEQFIASDNSLCYFFSLTAPRKLDEIFVQFDNFWHCYNFMPVS